MWGVKVEIKALEFLMRLKKKYGRSEGERAKTTGSCVQGLALEFMFSESRFCGVNTGSV